MDSSFLRDFYHGHFLESVQEVGDESDKFTGANI